MLNILPSSPVFSSALMFLNYTSPQFSPLFHTQFISFLLTLSPNSSKLLALASLYWSGLLSLRTWNPPLSIAQFPQTSPCHFYCSHQHSCSPLCYSKPSLDTFQGQATTSFDSPPPSPTTDVICQNHDPWRFLSYLICSPAHHHRDHVSAQSWPLMQSQLSTIILLSRTSYATLYSSLPVQTHSKVTLSTPSCPFSQSTRAFFA